MKQQRKDERKLAATGAESPDANAPDGGAGDETAVPTTDLEALDP